MNLQRLMTLGCAVMVAAVFSQGSARGITTADGQIWNYEPDAWTRANDADASHFGWDSLDRSGATLGFTKILDDSAPDISTGAITATDTRFYQVHTTAPYNGHVSGSLNYYSIFDTADDVISATAPASGSGGYTTVVLQVLGGAPSSMGPNEIDDLSFEMLTAGWTKEKNLYGVEAAGTGVYWQEWTAPGANLDFEINMTSTSEHVSLDAVQVDTFWSNGAAPVVNAISAIGIPEPGAAVLAALALVPLTLRRRHS